VNVDFALLFFMALPFFYKEDIDLSATGVELDEVTSKHVVQVLRMQQGEQLQLTDGNGNLFTCEIADNNRKKCAVTILKTTNSKPQTKNISIAISLLKNASRFEWFLEKATELGVAEIIPLVCERTEKNSFKAERMKSILVSAMLQSEQSFLPVLYAPKKFRDVLASGHQQKFIAHCIDGEKRELADLINENLSSKIILIGPAGDFTAAEIQAAVDHHFIPVALGSTRLRTETAGIAAAVLMRLI